MAGHRGRHHPHRGRKPTLANLSLVFAAAPELELTRHGPLGNMGAAGWGLKSRPAGPNGWNADLCGARMISFDGKKGVVLGVAIPLAVTTAVLHWDSIWLWLAYREEMLGKNIGDDQEYLGLLGRILHSTPGPVLDSTPPRAAARGVALVKRADWLPGPDYLFVFYASDGREIGRHTWDPWR